MSAAEQEAFLAAEDDVPFYTRAPAVAVVKRPDKHELTRNDRVRALVAQGKTLKEIAQTLHLPSLAAKRLRRTILLESGQTSTGGSTDEVRPAVVIRDQKAVSRRKRQLC